MSCCKSAVTRCSNTRRLKSPVRISILACRVTSSSLWRSMIEASKAAMACTVSASFLLKRDKNGGASIIRPVTSMPNILFSTTIGAEIKYGRFRVFLRPKNWFSSFSAVTKTNFVRSSRSASTSSSTPDRLAFSSGV